jgi:hypothetical protein
MERTPEQKAKHRDYMRAWYASRTPEERRPSPEQRARHNEQQRLRFAASEELRAIKREKRAARRKDNPEHHRAMDKARRSNLTPEQIERRRFLSRERRRLNPEMVRGEDRAYYRKNKEKVVRWVIEYRKRNPAAQLASDLRGRLNGALKNQWKRGSAVRLLGCSIPELMAHLESLFKPGMTWDNRGKYGWHIDHIVPLAVLDLTDPCELARGCHYTNLQPLWAAENLTKGMRPI